MSRVSFNFGPNAKLTGDGERFLKEHNKLQSLEVAIGFQSGSDSYDDGTDVCDVAIYNEFGTSTIPPRPFMKQSFESNADNINKHVQNSYKQLEAGSTAEAITQSVGTMAKGVIQDYIANGEFVPNAPSTIARKHSSRPLIDTGLMRQSVNFVVRGAGTTE